MTALLYKTMREAIAHQPETARLLDIPLEVLIARELGEAPISREAELAMTLLAEVARQQPELWGKSIPLLAVSPEFSSFTARPHRTGQVHSLSAALHMAIPDSKTS